MEEYSGSVEAGNPVADGAAGTDAMMGGQQSYASEPSQGSIQQPSTTETWYGGMPDEVRGLVETKGWKSPEDVVQSYTNLEKMLGADKAGRGLVLPKDDADQTEWDMVYDRLGRPKTPEEYNLPVPDGDTGQFAKIARDKFHELGITAKQAESLADWWNNQQSQMQNDMLNQQSQNTEMEMEVLKSEWGKSYDENIENARRAARTFNIDEQSLEKIEQALGTRDMLKMFADIGKSMSEDSFVDNTKASGFGTSPEAARVQLDRLKADSQWTAKYIAGDADARGEMERLMKIAYP